METRKAISAEILQNSTAYIWQKIEADRQIERPPTNLAAANSSTETKKTSSSKKNLDEMLEVGEMVVDIASTAAEICSACDDGDGPAFRHKK